MYSLSVSAVTVGVLFTGELIMQTTVTATGATVAVRLRQGRGRHNDGRQRR